MSAGPKHVGNVGKWRLLRWEYDDAPLMAECPALRTLRGVVAVSAWTVEINGDGELEFDGLDLGGPSPRVPVDVLRELVDDAIERGVWNPA